MAVCIVSSVHCEYCVDWVLCVLSVLCAVGNQLLSQFQHLKTAIYHCACVVFKDCVHVKGTDILFITSVCHFRLIKW